MDSVVIYKCHTFHTFIYFSSSNASQAIFLAFCGTKTCCTIQNDFTSSGIMIQKQKVQTPKVKIPPIQQMRNPDGGFLAIWRLIQPRVKILICDEKLPVRPGSPHWKVLSTVRPDSEKRRRLDIFQIRNGEQYDDLQRALWSPAPWRVQWALEACHAPALHCHHPRHSPRQRAYSDKQETEGAGSLQGFHFLSLITKFSEDQRLHGWLRCLWHHLDHNVELLRKNSRIQRVRQQQSISV